MQKCQTLTDTGLEYRKEEAIGTPYKDLDMAREHKFEIFEHTADVGVIGRGASMAEAFENLAYGMFSIMAELDRYEPTDSKQLHAAGLDDVVLLERFLTQLLVLFDSESVLPVDFEITEISLGRLTCWVSFRKIGPDIEWVGPSVKAVTYHQIAVENVGDEWIARAIFDV